MQERHLFTSESVSEGHPDKIADQISDAILDAMLEQDPDSRVACETTVTTGLVLVVGEISTKAYVDIQSVVRGTIKKIGYTKNQVLILIVSGCWSLWMSRVQISLKGLTKVLKPVSLILIRFSRSVLAIKA